MSTVAFVKRLDRPVPAVATAIGLWVAAVFVVSILVWHNPDKRTVLASYRDASARWFAGEDIYTGPSGMNYLPHFAILFRPFEAKVVGDILWRVFSLSCFVGAMWNATRLLAPDNAARAFHWATWLSLPLALGALRNGQSNLLFAAALLQATCYLSQRRWWSAALTAGFAMAVKPLAIVLLLLAPFGFRPMWWRTLIVAGGLVVVPFLFGSPDYVISQYELLLANARECSVESARRFANLFGLLQVMSLPVRPEWQAPVSLAGALGTWIAWLFLCRNTEIPERAAILFTFSAGYLMLFNPIMKATATSFSRRPWLC